MFGNYTRCFARAKVLHHEPISMGGLSLDGDSPCNALWSFWFLIPADGFAADSGPTAATP